VTIYRMLAVLGAAVVAFSASVAQRDNSGPSADVISHGKYLVEGVAHCRTCHTPRDQQGQPDRQRWLLGGPIPFEPARPTEGWAEIAPRFAGTPPGTDEQFVRLMMTGIARSRRPPRPPMPQFRMTRSDAEAVLAHLKSLKTTE